jgi:hypothetical protein
MCPPSPAGSDYVPTAGYKASAVRPSHLSRNVKVQARVAELVCKAAEKASVTVLAKVGFRHVRRAPTYDGDV